MVRTRIAPSPTGNPHLATLFQALINYVFAKKHKGQFLVRIEDTDQSRLVKGSEKAIFDSLEWLGLVPDESPIHQGKFGPYRQSERLKIYQEYADKLLSNQKAYYCFCSSERLEKVRKQMSKEGKPPMYDGHCRKLDPQESKKKAQTSSHVVRLKVPEDETIVINDLLRGEVKFDSNLVDDQVLVKSDGFPTYHLAVVVDDHLMEISHLVRGEEWLSSGPKHVLLYRFFGWKMPVFIHTPILRNPDRSKLSKRHGHAAVSWYRQKGYLKEAVINFLASRVWNHPQGKEVYDLTELIKHFDLSHMHLTGPVVDLDKLNWLNGQWLRRLPDNKLKSRLKPFLPEKIAKNQFELIWPLIKERVEHLSQISDLIEYFITQPKLNLKEILKESKMSATNSSEYLKKVAKTIESVDWSVKALENSLHKLQESEGLKPRPAFMTIRLAVTGQSATPPLFDTLFVLGKKTVIKRLNHAQKVLTKA